MKKPKEAAVKASRRVWLLAVLVPVASLAALCIGRIPLSPADVVRTILGHLTGNVPSDSLVEMTVWKIRLPRILLAILTGAGLSASGCAFQSLFANPLATPDTLGVASGACFGAALGILLGLTLPGIQLLSLAAGLFAVALTVLSGGGKGARGMNRVVLSGIMIGSLFSALVSFVKFAADTENQLPAITYWLMGSLSSASYPSLLLGAPPIFIGIVVLWLLRWRLNLLPLGEEEARSCGVNIRLLRIVTVLCATVMTASCVSMCGQVGWVGLLVPHMCRMRYGSNHVSLYPASVFAGAVFLTIVDTAARSLTASELPVSILTALVGAPFFIYLMRRTEGWQI